MDIWDYEGYATREDGVVCKDCTGNLTESEERELGYSPIYAGSVHDFYPVCGICDRELDYVGLSEEGRGYQRELDEMNGKKRKKR